MPPLGLTGMLALTLGASAGHPAPSAVQLVAPESGRPVSGEVPFLVRAARPPHRAAFAVDGWVLDVDRRAPFALGRAGVLDTGTLSPGPHRLSARVELGGRTITLGRTIRVAATAAAPPSRPAWSDEFSGPAGRPPDRANWGYDLGRWGRTAGELQTYTNRTTNAALDGAGNLRIVARRQAAGGAAYTSARIHTLDRFEPRFGRIEARIKVPAGQGLLPAFWLLGGDWAGAVPWPQSGEIDVMEVPGQDPFGYQGTVHGPQVGAPAQDVAGERSARSPSPYSDGFHVYAIEWRPGSIQFLVDGQPVGDPVTPTAYAALGGRWVFDLPFYLVLNVAVGNVWTGPPDPTTHWPAVMLVDWVRAYR